MWGIATPQYTNSYNVLKIHINYAQFVLFETLNLNALNWMHIYVHQLLSKLFGYGYVDTETAFINKHISTAETSAQFYSSSQRKPVGGKKPGQAMT